MNDREKFRAAFSGETPSEELKAATVRAMLAKTRETEKKPRPLLPVRRYALAFAALVLAIALLPGLLKSGRSGLTNTDRFTLCDETAVLTTFSARSGADCYSLPLREALLAASEGSDCAVTTAKIASSELWLADDTAEAGLYAIAVLRLEHAHNTFTLRGDDPGESMTVAVLLKTAEDAAELSLTAGGTYTFALHGALGTAAEYAGLRNVLIVYAHGSAE